MLITEAGEKLQWGAAEQGVLKVIDSNWVN